MKSIQKKNHLVFIDIETVASSPCYCDLSDTMKALWDIKSRFLSLSANGHDATPSGLYPKKAGIYSEFSRVLCVSIAESYESNGENIWVQRSFYGHNETQLLTELTNHLQSSCPLKSFVKLIGHNIREFDVPFLIRRMIINEAVSYTHLTLPTILLV